MFESYNIKTPLGSRVGGPDTKFLTVEIVDSTFKEEVIAEADHTGIDIMTPLIALYEDKGLNVAANITKAYVYMCKRFSLEPKGFLKRTIALNKDVARYKDDIEKYLSLL